LGGLTLGAHGLAAAQSLGRFGVHGNAGNAHREHYRENGKKSFHVDLLKK
jgi:hypothetical protein